MSAHSQKARELALAWLSTQAELPLGYRLNMEGYDREIGGIFFKVDYYAKGLQQNFCLLEFYVLENGEIKVKAERKDVSRQAGLATEDRFLSVMRARTENTPPWFHSIKKADRFFDKRGIDAFAYVDYWIGEEDLKIPIQIKSSRAGVQTYYRKNPLCKEYGVVALVVNYKRTDDQLREYVYQALEQVRYKKIKDGGDFKQLYRLLGKT